MAIIEQGGSIQISPQIGEGLQVYFDRGLLSTQRVSRAFNGKPAKGKLIPQIEEEPSKLRASLAGDMVEALMGFVSAQRVEARSMLRSMSTRTSN